MTNAAPILVLDNVHAAYMKKEILRGLSLTVNTGEIVALLGENGAGKSTTLKVIAGLLKPLRGSVYYRGRELNGLDISQRQQLGIGYLMQGGHVFSSLTVEENFNLAVSKARKCDDKCSNLGEWFPVLRDRKVDRAGLLSGGQRQMLAIEMVLFQRPDLLLLDEPTTALCGDLAREILLMIRRCVDLTGVSALLIEQNIKQAQSVSDRTLQLTRGEIVNKGINNENHQK